MKSKFKRISKSTLSVILALMMVLSTMLIGTMSVSAAISYWQVAGDFNTASDSTDWASSLDNTAYRIDGSTGSVTLDLNDKIGKTINFKMVAIEDGNKYWCGANSITMGEACPLSWGKGENLSLTISKRYVTFTMTSGNILTVTESNTNGSGSDTPDIAKDTTIYFDNSVAKWSTVKIHLWNQDNKGYDSNVEMTHVEGDIYSYTFTDDYTGDMVFMNESWENSNQTNDTSSSYVKNGNNLAKASGGNSSNKHNVSWSVYSSSQTYTVTAGTQTGGTVKVNGGTSATVAENGTVTLTAEATGNYEFKHWNAVSGITYTAPNSATTTATVTGDATVTATFEEKEPVTYRLNGSPRVTGKTNTVTAYADSLPFDDNNEIIINYTYNNDNDNYFSIVGSDGKYYDPSKDSVNVTDGVTNSETTANSSKRNNINFYFNASGTYKISLNTSGNTPTVTVTKVTIQPSDVTPTFADGKTEDTVTAYVDREKTLNVTATLQGVSNPQNYLSYSTVSTDGKLTISAANTSSPKFTANSAGTYTVTTTVTNKADETKTVIRTTTVTVTEAPAVEYKVAINNNSTVDMHETSVAGVYISESIISKDTHFRIKDSDGKYSARGDNKPTDGDYYLSNTDDRSAKVSDNWLNSYASSNDWYVNCDNVYVVYDSNKGIIYLSTDPNNKQSFTIYAKPGTVRNNKYFHETTGFLRYGTTTVSGAGDVDETREIWYSTTRLYKDVAEDTAITITTTMSSTGNSQGYYVWAFCVNGKYVEAIKDVDTEGNVIYRSPTYRLTSDNAVNNKFEITPIYLNSIVEADGDYIHLYVDASTVKEAWGDTVAVYPYEGDGTTEGSEPFGDYPGQPMVLRGRFYEILVPRHKYVMTDGKLTKTNTYMSGLTVCNYAEETIHPEVIGYTTNYQTYDYSDFIQLSKDPEVKAVLFAIKSYTDNDNGLVASNQTIGSTISNDWNNLDVNRFEDFTDYYGRNTDIFGNILSKDDMNKTAKVHIISVGNQTITKTDSLGEYDTVGKWATRWFIYDDNGRLLSVGTPSEYIDENSPKYKALLKDYGSDCKNLQTYISYDREKISHIQTDMGGVRSDGRWYYSKVNDLEFTSDVAIEYNSGNGEWIEDENSGVKNEDGFVSTVTNGSVARLDGVREATYKSVDGTATISVDVKDGWTFAGWYIKSKNADDSYSYYEISKTNTTVNDFQMNNSYHIVARLEKIPEGSLVLRHTQYSGTNPPAHSGGSIVGQYFIKAVVKDSDNNIVKTYDFTEDPISIDYLRSDYTIDITLKTVCYEPNTFYSWYQMAPDGNYFEICPEDYDPKGQDGELTFAMNLKCSQLFNGQDLEVNVIRFYSDLVKVSGTCDITYKYYDRFAENGVGKMVSYVVNDVELSPVEIKAGYIPSNETIEKYAPYIDTIYLDTKWDLTDSGKVTKTKSYAEVTATQSEKMCTVYYPTGEYFNGPCESFAAPYNAFLGNGDVNNPDTFNFLLTAPDKNAEGKEFSYWNIYKADVNGNKIGTLIATCYDRTFNFRIYDDYYLEVVYGEKIDEISAEISDPNISREIFGDASSATDRLYVDLLVSYYSSLVPVFKDNNTNYTVECGVIVDRNNKYVLSDEDMNTIKTAAQNGTELDSEILNKYFDNSGIKSDEALSVAQNQELGDKSKTTYTDTSGCEHRLSKYVLNNEDLTNKNRIDKVLVYTNNEANQKYIFAAYAYVIVRNADGTIAQCDISNANEVQFYNLCYTANIPAQTSAI